jgi:hypothetical protein
VSPVKYELGFISQKTTFFIVTAVKTSKSYTPRPSPPSNIEHKIILLARGDRLCLVIKVPGCRSKGPGFDSRQYRIFLELVEGGPLRVLNIFEQLFD